MSETTAKPLGRRLRRWVFRVALGALAVMLCAKIAVRFIDFAPLIEKEVSKAIGLKMEIGRLDNQAIPGARLTARKVTLGENDFQACAELVVAEGSLLRLANKHVKVTRGVIENFRVQFPNTFSAIVERWEAAEARKDAGKRKAPSASSAPASPQPKDDDWEVEFNDVTALDTIVYMGDSLALRGDLYGTGLLSDLMHFRWRADVPRFGPRARMTGDAYLAETGAPDPALNGKAILRGFSLRAMGVPAFLPDGAVDAGVEAQGAFTSDLSFDVQGDLLVPEVPGFSGAFSGLLWLQDGRVTVNAFKFAGSGLDVSGDLTVETDGRVACNVAALDATGNGLTALAGLASSKRGALTAAGEGRLSVKEFLFGTGEDGALRFVRGSATLSGIDFALPDGSMAFDDLAGEASVSEGAVEISELRGAGFLVHGSVRPDWNTGALAVDLAGEAELSPARLAPWLPLDTVQDLHGRLVAERFVALLGSDAPLTDSLELRAQLDGVSAAVHLAGYDAPLSIEQVSGRAAYEKGVLQLSGLRGTGFAVDGTVTTDNVSGALSVDLSGELDLGGGIPALFLPAGLITGLEGKASFTKIAGSFPEGAAAPQGLYAEGTIRDGKAEIAVGGVTEKWSEVSLSFVTAEEHVETTIERIRSDRAGVITGGVNYGAADQTAQGTLTLDLGALPDLLLDEGATRRQLEPFFDAYGKSTVDFSVRFPAQRDGAWTIDLHRHESPPLDAHLVLSRKNGQLVPDEIAVDASVPAHALRAFLPGNIEAGGDIQVQMKKVADSPDFSIDAQLDAASIVLGKRLQKRPGDPMSVRITGHTGENGFRLATVRIACLGQQAVLEFTETGIRAPNVDIDLAGLVRLLPDGGAAHGRVSGEWSPPTGRFQLENAGLSFAPGAEIDSMSGEVMYQDGYLLCNNVQITGADSDCTINARIQDGLWEAEVSGQKLDLDAVDALLDTVRSVGSPESTGAGAAKQSAPAATAPPGPDAPGGRVTVYLNSLFFRRGRIDDVRAEVLVRPRQFVFQNLTFRPYSGLVSGAFILTRDPAPGRIDLDLALTDADLKLLDDVAFEEPREMAGIANGTVKLAFPLGDAEQSLKGVTGQMNLDIREGTYGKLGTVTQALAFFRIFEFIRLSVPQLQHKGLAFDRSLLAISADTGVVSLDSFTLTSKSYAIDGYGTINYRDDTMDVVFRVNLLELVTGLITHVPVIGIAVDRLASLTEIGVKGTGSPFAPEFSLSPGIVQRKPENEPDTPPEDQAVKEESPRPKKNRGR